MAVDPALRTVVGRRSEQPAANTNTLSRLAPPPLSAPANLEKLTQLNSAWVARALEQTKSWRIVLDLDSSESPGHGQQEGSSYQGHFGLVCYHPLFCFKHWGACEAAGLRPGHVPSAEGWPQRWAPVVARYRASGLHKYLRAAGACAKPEVYAYLEQEGFGYTLRLPANEVLMRHIDPLLTRPVGRPPKRALVW